MFYSVKKPTPPTPPPIDTNKLRNIMQKQIVNKFSANSKKYIPLNWTRLKRTNDDRGSYQEGTMFDVNEDDILSALDEEGLKQFELKSEGSKHQFSSLFTSHEFRDKH